MIQKILRVLDKLFPAQVVFAHCDIPCGIYDPHAAHLAAKTVLTMVQKIKALPENKSLVDQNNFVRMVKVKEEHAELCKREVLVLWTDYFKPEHLEKFPDLHDLVWRTTKLCSDNKRAIDDAKARELVVAVDKIAEIFEKAEKAKLK